MADLNSIVFGSDGETASDDEVYEYAEDDSGELLTDEVALRRAVDASLLDTGSAPVGGDGAVLPGTEAAAPLVSLSAVPVAVAPAHPATPVVPEPVSVEEGGALGAEFGGLLCAPDDDADDEAAAGGSVPPLHVVAPGQAVPLVPPSGAPPEYAHAGHAPPEHAPWNLLDAVLDAFARGVELDVGFMLSLVLKARAAAARAWVASS
ncbi:hypothetical protein JL720_17333 [Aureococcus anophagefferens]|nr:hypothetical protein JL720_17333 [Aureococcus anophagefferens]